VGSKLITELKIREGQMRQNLRSEMDWCIRRNIMKS